MKAEQAIQAWPDVAKKAASHMLQKYGEPDGVTQMMLIWERNGPWLRTIVHREEVPHEFPTPHKDVLEQFVAYRVPPDKFDDLAEFDGSVIVERTKGVMSARCEAEDANFLALNLAHDIVQGRRGVEEARRVYAETMQAFYDGKDPDYMKRLVFEPADPAAAQDPDSKIM